jgi:hypothetical protein
MERELLIFEMSDEANPIALACSQLLEEPLAWAYGATRARRAVNPKAVWNSDDDLWSFAMLPSVGQVSVIPSPFALFISVFGLMVAASDRGWASMSPRRIRRHLGCRLLTVYIRIKVQVDLQADKSSVVVKGPFFHQV